jgi:hypothetical protein
MDAFKALCSGNNGNTLMVPEKYSFFVRPTLNFTGPCKSKNINIKVQELEAFILILFYLFQLIY